MSKRCQASGDSCRRPRAPVVLHRAHEPDVVAVGVGDDRDERPENASNGGWRATYPAPVRLA